MAEARIVETFNTHRMSDAVVRAVAIGRDDELAEIVPAIRRAAASPEQPPQALIVYGERGSGKSFLMRLVQIECAAIEGVACVLLPEEQYNIRAPHQLLDVVAAHVRGDDWSAMGWQIDARTPEQAWDESLAAFHAALDARFGAGRGMAVVLLENFDTLAEKLFGASAPARSAKGRSAPARGQAVARRQAEERLRKLMGARGGRFMLIASATGTVDMDYERPLFQAFKPVDLQSWTSDTAIGYFNKRRALDGMAALSTEQEARARAIIEFIGGNARLTQLLGTVLASPSAHTIADTLDQLVDQLADYYRQRMDALPPAAAGVLDALIRGGEPVSQTALAQRVGGQQSQIADAFSYLTRARLVQAASERGGASQLYRVRDRLFVHLYRRRYGGSRGLAPIAELLERFFTPQEREEQIRSHLARGEFEDARAFGRLPLDGGSAVGGYCRFRDGGVVDLPASEWFALAGVPDAEVEGLRISLRDKPDRAFQEWAERAARASAPAERAAARNLQAIAASRNGHDRIALSVLEESLADARTSGDPDAIIFASVATSIFAWNRGADIAGAVRAVADIESLAMLASSRDAKALAFDSAHAAAHEAGRPADAEAFARAELEQATLPRLRLRALHTLGWALSSLDKQDEALSIFDAMVEQAREQRSALREADGEQGRATALLALQRPLEAVEAARRSAELALSLDARKLRCDSQLLIADASRAEGQHDAAVAQFREVRDQALAWNLAKCAMRAWSSMLETLAASSRHDEVIASGLEAMERADALGLRTEKAMLLLIVAVSEFNLSRYETSLTHAREGLRIVADSEGRTPALSVHLGRVAAMSLEAIGGDAALAEGAVIARTALRVAIGSSDPRLIEPALIKLIQLCGTTPVRGAMVDVRAAISKMPDWWWVPALIGLCITSASRTDEWDELDELLHEQAEHAVEPWRGLALVFAARYWSDVVRSAGRALAFSKAQTAMAHVRSLIAALPAVRDRLSDELISLANGLIPSCSDFGFLRDMATLLEETFAGAATDASSQLRAFADFHAADDKEAHLQRIDPDLATAIRRVWNLPEPRDTLALRGRKRAR